jgi:dihydropteroate synthase
VVDPGIGFGKTIAHNLTLIRHLGELAELGYPVLLGASRKAFIGALTGREPLDRLWGTMGVHVAGALMGAHIVRVHDVAPLKEALTMSDAIARS